MAVMSFSRDIWCDEAFSLNMVKHSYAEIISLTATDVHPPLYYIILKSLVDLGHALLPSMPIVFAAKLVSVVPHVILFAVIAGKMCRDFGIYVASMAALCIVGMLHQLEYGVEIRMYSWAMCFVTLTFLQIRDIVNGRSGRSWVLFVAFSLCAAYTHNYALVAVGLLWLALLVWLCVSERRQVWKWAVAAFATAVGYLPWLIVLIKQLQAVSEKFWQDDLEFGAKLVKDSPLLLLIVILLFYVFFRKKRTDRDDIFAYIGVALPFGVIAVGIAVSLIVRPLFISRYVFPGLGCLWIGLPVLFGKTGTRAMKTMIGVMVALICVTHIVYFTYKETKFLVSTNQTCEFLKAHKDAVFITDANHYPLTVATLSDGSECFLWREGEKDVVDEIKTRIDSKSVVVFAFIRDEKDDDTAVIDEMLRGSSLGYTLVDRLRISNSDAKVYRIIKTTASQEP